MIDILQAGRFFAAMVVVIHHADLMVTAFAGEPPGYLRAAMAFGYLGVDFFFVLSGFIIHYTMVQMPRSAGQFAYDRLTRIMLPYWPVGIGIALAYSAIPSFSKGGRAWDWLSTITLFPTGLEPALVVAWTLQHELVFYLLYAALFFSGRVALGLTIWAAAIIAACFVAPPDLPLIRVVLAPINIEFVAGAVAAAVFMRDRRPGALVSIALAGACLAAFVAAGADRPESWLVGLSIAALLPWLCQRERAGALRVPGWLVWGGGASYAIYLVHTPLLSLMSRAFGSVGMGWLPALVLSVGFCAAAGAIYYMAWERPMMRIVKRPRRRPMPATS